MCSYVYDEYNLTLNNIVRVKRSANFTDKTRVKVHSQLQLLPALCQSMTIVKFVCSSYQFVRHGNRALPKNLKEVLAFETRTCFQNSAVRHMASGSLHFLI